MEQTEYISVGRFGRTRGVDGELNVTPLTDFPDRFVDLKSVYLEIDGRWSEFEIETVQMLNGRPVMKLKTVDSLEQAARLVNCELAVRRDQLVPLPAGQHYIFELVGCSVVDDKTQQVMGVITDVLRYPANDVYLIRSTDGRELMCPAVAAFVRKVEVSAGRVLIDSSGLLTNEAT